MASSDTKSRDEFLLVAAIDLGTSFSGYAFSWRGKEDEIRMNKSWGASLGFQSYKAPTSVLTTRAGEFLAFGYEAETTYSEALEESENEEEEGEAELDMLLFRNFKMILYHARDVKLSTTITSVDGTIIPAIDIFTHAMKYLRDHMLDALGSETERPPDWGTIRWVITVPAIWSEEAKQFMREVAYRAGCSLSKDSKRTIVALEPEAASVCCRRLDLAQYDDKNGIIFTTGTKYIVLDCGGGTVDITVHEIEFDKIIKELHRATGGPWGGTQVDANFIELMESVLGKDFIDAFQKKYPREWLQFVTEFERTKKSFKPDGKSKITLDLMFSMITLYARMNDGKRIDKALKDSAERGVTFANGMLVVLHDAAIRLFTPVVESIVQHMQGLLKDSNLKDMDYLLMVGGFSECLVLQEEVKAQLQENGLKVLVPSEAQLSIIKGAVMFGHRPAEIGTRRSRYSIGINVLTEFDKRIHDEKRKVECDSGTRCTDVFKVLVKQDEELTIGTQKIANLTTANNLQTKGTVNVYSIDGQPAEPVQYTDAPNCNNLGCVRVQLTGSGLGREIRVTVTFGGTEMHVEAIEEATGKSFTTTLDFLSD